MEGDLVCLAVGVVVAALRSAALVAAEQHRHALGQHQRRDEVAPLALAGGADARIAGRSLDAEVLPAVVAGAVAVGLAVGLVVLALVRHEANGESNRDGTDDDRGENFGVEGPTDDPRISAARVRRRRNFVATLMLSQGVPMLLGGDERGRTQGGNNNAYCQANEISFYDWSDDPAAAAFQAFTAHAIDLHLAHPVLRRTSFLYGGGSPPDISWYETTGQPMTGAAWSDPANHFIAYLLAGDGADEPDDDLLVVLNATLERVSFTAPGIAGQRFTLLLDTGFQDGRPLAGTGFEKGDAVDVAPQTVLVASAPRP